MVSSSFTQKKKTVSMGVSEEEVTGSGSNSSAVRGRLSGFKLSRSRHILPLRRHTSTSQTVSQATTSVNPMQLQLMDINSQKQLQKKKKHHQQSTDMGVGLVITKPRYHNSLLKSKLATASTSAGTKDSDSLLTKLETSPTTTTILMKKDKYHFVTPRLKSIRNSAINNTAKTVVGPQAKCDLGKLTLVLDVDETLIHSRMNIAPTKTDKYRQAEQRQLITEACDEFILKLEDGDTVHVNKRPGLDGFLKHVGERYEVVAYTAGLEQYAKPLLDWLDPQGKVFRHRLYRDSCLYVNGMYLKDLEKVNRCLSRTVLVDNNVYCFLPQLCNGIPISSFYDDPQDTALSVLADFLDSLDYETDVRPALEKRFSLHSVLKTHRDRFLGTINN